MGKEFESQITSPNLVDNGIYLLESSINDIVNDLNLKSFPVLFGHNTNDINQYVGYSIKGSAKKDSDGKVFCKFKTLDTDTGKLFETIMQDENAPMGYSITIMIDDYEFDESSKLFNVAHVRVVEFSATTTPCDDTTIGSTKSFNVNIDTDIGINFNSVKASFAKWDVKYINELPNTSFAVVEKDYKDGTIKDKSARHLPYKDVDGNIDLPHLRNALARMGQIEAVGESETSEELRAKARKVLIPLAKKYLPDSKWAKEKSNDIEVEDMDLDKMAKDIVAKTDEAFEKANVAKNEVPEEVLEDPKVEDIPEEVKVESVQEDVVKEDPIVEDEPSEVETMKKELQELKTKLAKIEKDTLVVNFYKEEKEVKNEKPKDLDLTKLWNI
jgi:hypothetical protein